MRLAIATLVVAPMATAHERPAPPVVFTTHATSVVPAADEQPVPPPVGSFTQRYPYLIPRASVDRPDERAGRQIHFVYLVPNGFPDERLDELAVLEDSVRAMNGWMAGETGLRWKLDTFVFEWDDPATPEADPVAIEAVDVTFLRIDRPGAELTDLTAVRDELIARGFDHPEKRYFTFAANNAGLTCGVASTPLYPGQEPVGWDPSIDGKYSMGNLFSDPGCRMREFATGPADPSWVEAVVLHEIVHNDGHLVAYAPHSWPPASGHPRRPVPSLKIEDIEVIPEDPERYDVMYASASFPLSEKVLDLGNDDYFRHPFPWRDLDQSPYLESAA